MKQRWARNTFSFDDGILELLRLNTSLLQTQTHYMLILCPMNNTLKMGQFLRNINHLMTKFTFKTQHFSIACSQLLVK